LHTASGADGTFAVSVCADDGQIRVQVHDSGSASTPVVCRSDTTAEAGRGLALWKR
jgi:hypothetical protein